MASLFGFTVTAWNEGTMERAHRRSAPIEPDPGFDGLALVSSGWVAPEVQITTTTVITGGITAAETLIDNMRRLQIAPTVGLVIDQHGRRFPNCVCSGVRCQPLATENPNVWHVRTMWMIVPETQRP